MPFTLPRPGTGFQLPGDMQLCCGSSGGSFVGQYGDNSCNSNPCGLQAQYLTEFGLTPGAQDLIFANLNQFWWQNYGVRLYDIVGKAIKLTPGAAVRPLPNVGKAAFALTPTLAPKPLTLAPSPDLTPSIGRPAPKVRLDEKRVPPGKRVKEKKGLARKGLAFAVARAFDATEAVDAVDALFGALPKDVQKGVTRSGRVRKGGMAPEGTKYLTVFDKLGAVYRNLDRLNLNQAAYNLLVNHITDKIVGSVAGGAGRRLRNMGGSTQGGIALGGMWS